LKPAARTTGAEIVPPELLDEFDVAVDDAIAAADPRFRRERSGGACS